MSEMQANFSGYYAVVAYTWLILSIFTAAPIIWFGFVEIVKAAFK